MIETKEGDEEKNKGRNERRRMMEEAKERGDGGSTI